MVLAGGEFTEINTENSILIIDQLVDKFWWLCPLRELILDHGSEFGAHRIHDDGSWNSEFKDHLKKYGIKPILARVKHPQTNGSWNGFSENTSSTGLLFIHSTYVFSPLLVFRKFPSEIN